MNQIPTVNLNPQTYSAFSGAEIDERSLPIDIFPTTMNDPFYSSCLILDPRGTSMSQLYELAEGFESSSSESHQSPIAYSGDLKSSSMQKLYCKETANLMSPVHQVLPHSDSSDSSSSSNQQLEFMSQKTWQEDMGVQNVPRSWDSSQQGDAETVMVVDRRVHVHVLPPCKVCGVQATGFHYGVNTCEACKGFFRRCLVRAKKHKACLKGNRCALSKANARKMCVFCRYEKCIRVGMSLEGIRTGRYTYEKKSQDIMEIKKYRQEKHPKTPAPQSLILQSKAMETVMSILSSQEEHCAGHMRHIQYLKEVSHGQKNYHAVHPNTDKTLVGSTDVWRMMEKGINGSVRYAKSLPAFRRLHMKDQMELIKRSIIDIWIVARFYAFDEENETYITFDRTSHMIDGLLEPALSKQIFKTTKMLKRLDLTSEDIILMKTLVLFYPDCCELMEPHIVEQGKEEIFSALQYLLRRNHPGRKYLLAKVVSALCSLRDVAYALQQNKKGSFKHIDKAAAPLLAEVLDAS